MSDWIKPPLGVSPHWYIYNKRIKELCEAITRYSDFIMHYSDVQDEREYYELISKWATEIKMLAEIEIPLLTADKQEKQQGQYIKFIHGAHTKYGYGCGKVIGEFVCDKVEKLEEHIEQGGLYYILSDTFNEQAQLDNWELHDYGKGKTLYGWHISDLKIYDKPRELSEFSRPCSYSGLCFSCKRASFKKDGNLLCNTKITRPPQSWMYVEDLGEEE